MGQSFNNHLEHEYPGGDAPFRAAETFGPQPFAHNDLDAVRMNWRRTPEATYPDGYLGTVPSRRGDRLLDGLKARTTNKPYTRGVHKGERMNQRDYFWTDDFHPLAGIEAQAEGRKWSPPGLGEYLPDERYPTDRRVGPRGVSVGSRYQQGGGPAPEGNDDRRDMLRQQAPGWASGGTRGNPGMAVHTRGGV